MYLLLLDTYYGGCFSALVFHVEAGSNELSLESGLERDLVALAQDTVIPPGGSATPQDDLVPATFGGGEEMSGDLRNSSGSLGAVGLAEEGGHGGGGAGGGGSGGVVVAWSALRERFWEDGQMPFFLVSFSVLGLLILASVLLLWAKKSRVLLPGSKGPTPIGHGGMGTTVVEVGGGGTLLRRERWVFHPVVRPPLDRLDAVQPRIGAVVSEEGVEKVVEGGVETLAVVGKSAREKVEEAGPVEVVVVSLEEPNKDPPEGKTDPVPSKVTVVEPTVSKGIGILRAMGAAPVPVHSADGAVEAHPEPIRVRARGLLERRGSSASLTIDLQPSPPVSERANGSCAPVTPTRECSTEEYLLSAGNRLSRGQLRTCLRDPKTLHNEFWEVPSNHPEHSGVAGSGTRNRYRSILPNERSRVNLREKDNDPLTSYINANYVRGYDGEEKAYIATQGPLPHTVLDFWEMVLQEHAPAIVMITKLKEKGRPKCENYLPGEDGEGEKGSSVTHGDITITIQNVFLKAGYTVRELTVQRGEEVHGTLHFWYTGWPDHRTPPSAKPLVAMALEVETTRHNSDGSPKGPVVVHCSAGIGRTGCFIALSVGMRQLVADGNVDVLGTVCAMRYDRGGMIQTGEQYEFVHRALCLFERSLPDQSGE